MPHVHPGISTTAWKATSQKSCAISSHRNYPAMHSVWGYLVTLWVGTAPLFWHSVIVRYSSPCRPLRQSHPRQNALGGKKHSVIIWDLILERGRPMMPAC